MLSRTFVHLPGIGASTEKKLWAAGISDWTELKANATDWFRGERLTAVVSELDGSMRALADGDAMFFYRRLARREMWRMVPDFRDSIAFLDIETDGLLLPPVSRSTSITFYYRGEIFQAYEVEAKYRLVRRMADEAAMFCTYFGEIFDLPFLRREFGLPLDKAHIDLSFWFRRLGFEGGLKRVEKCFAQIPQRSCEIGGLDAVRLWNWHLKGTPGALDALLAYNAEDTVVLRSLLIAGFNIEVQARPHLTHAALEFPEYPDFPTRIPSQIYERLRVPAASSFNTVSMI